MKKTPFDKTPLRFTAALVVFFLVFALLSCASGPPARPAWVDSPDSIPDSRQYIAATGHGHNRMAAENAAFAALAMRFGQRIDAGQRIEVIAAGTGAANEWTTTAQFYSTIATAGTMNFLIGAEIREVWSDDAGNHHASAVMNRAQAAQIYSDLIRSNLAMIGSLTAMTAAERNSIAGFARYSLAAAAADASASYAGVLNVIGAPPVPGVRGGDQYRLAAAGIAANIPVMVTVAITPGVDPGGRIHAAFSSAVSDTGLRTVNSGAMYTLEVSVNMSEAVFPNQQHIFVTYEITANFVNSATRVSQMPVFSINGRAGGGNLAQAENQAITNAERRIASQYAELLADGLFNILPAR